MHKPLTYLYTLLPEHFWRKIFVIRPNHRPALNPCKIKIVHILQSTITKITKQRRSVKHALLSSIKFNPKAILRIRLNTRNLPQDFHFTFEVD